MIAIGPALASQPAWLKAVSIIVGTFILEDVATVLSGVAARAGHVSIALALGALWFGVAIGDFGLYGLGAAGARWPRLRRFLTLPKQERTQDWFSKNVIRIVAISRFVPGARLPLYTACGFFHAPFLRFALTAVLATLVWTTLLFLLAMRIGGWLLAHQGGWRWAGLAGFVLCIVVVGRLIARIQTVSQ
ncbi:VTT domain-containing protein [Gluconobacter cerinus]|uniref:DedA family protein n=1 Tax=Gluconobacter cerinus TaxID=38307 RepID=UPI001B8AB89C|nr:VTT domain-containing protein [Gluconobacter cerinus]MBS1041197.1 VTT domain-containing protein [Gluconobacter cerinus]MBS1047742.1 VTT domain-containing protein [Gluconobacter cerinus]